MPKLFVFGTLMTRELLEVVLGRALRNSELQPAEALHFRRHALLQDPSFGILRPEFGSRVQGKIVEVTLEELKRVDFYEHHMYHRTSIEILVNGKTTDAFAYLDDETAPVLEDDWNEAEFTEKATTSVKEAKRWMDTFR